MTPAARPKPLATVEFTVPVRVLTNTREHWAKKAKRIADERGWTRWATRAATNRCSMEPPYRVSVTRVYPNRGKAMDAQNLPDALKAVIDGIADELGIDDGDERIEWVWGQEVGDEYAVRVRIEEAERSMGR